MSPSSAPVPPFAITGRIATVAGAADAEAVLIIGGRIAEVGDQRIAEQARAAGIEVRDVGERLVLPGFVDPHIVGQFKDDQCGRHEYCHVISPRARCWRRCERDLLL
jgi:imidazolonepropionase-like amidohydrolase